jgi:hypothetical protein
MAISMDLRVLARKLEKSSDDLLVSASKKNPDVFQKVATAIAAASTLLEGVADDMDNHASFEITPQQLDEIAALASAFDESEDPLLKKQASVLDELLLSIAAPKNAVAAARKVTEDEINRLRTERRKTTGEECYDEPRKRLSTMENAQAQAKAVEQQVKRYVPMEAPLQTRYPPDRPGGQMTRITDHVYQDIVTGIIYDYKAGYKTQKGNEVPGGSVENQTHDLGDIRDQGMSLFETRESLMGRYASSDKQIIVKIATALKAIRDHAPGLLDRAIDNAMDAGLSTSQVAIILASDISDAGLKTLADDESDKKKRVPLKSKINRTLSKRESEDQYYNAKSVLQPLSEIVKADPKNSTQWIRMMDDTLKSLEDIGMHQNHLALLNAEFIGNKPDFGVATIPPSAPPPAVIPSMERPRYKDEIEYADTATAHQSLMALVINAVQEIAPHLLKSAIAKAKAEGLQDQQIKSVLTSGFNSQFEKPTDEVKVAESLFPHLRDLGWTDLIDKHIKVMASFGVNKDTLQKIADQYSSDDNKSLNLLSRILKEAAVPAPVLDLGGKLEPNEIPSALEAPLPATAPVQILDPFEGERATTKHKITSEKLPDLAQYVIGKLKAGLVDPKEYHRFKLSLHGKDLVDAAANYEVQKFRKEMNAEMFSEFANLVRDWAYAEFGSALQEQVAPEAPAARTEKKRPAIVPIPKADEGEYDENSPEYQAAEEEAKAFFAEGEPKKIISEIYQFEKSKKRWVSDEDTKASKMFYTMTERIVDRNASGEPTPTNDEIFENILDEMRKIKYGPWNPKVKEKEIPIERQVPPPSKEHLEIGKTIPEEKPELSAEKPASNSQKYKYLRWGDYQKHWGITINEVQAKELENKIESKIKSDNDKLEEALRNFVYNVDKDPESVTSLPDDIRGEVMDMLGRGESSKAVSEYLVEESKDRHIADMLKHGDIPRAVNTYLAKKNRDPKLKDPTAIAEYLKNTYSDKSTEFFTVPSLNDLKASRFLRVGPQKTQEINAYRTDIKGRIIRRSVNKVLGEAGFKPMIELGEDDNITFNQVNIDLRNIMGEERAKAPFFKKQPIGPDGKKLVQFWQDPEEYWDAFVAAKNHFEGYGDAEKKAQADEMVSKGFNSPDEPVFGYQTTRQLLRNLDKKVSGNILPNYHGLKTLFSDPEEYQQAFVEAQKQFSTQWRDKPDEWNKIVGSNKDNLADIPIGIKSKILPLAVKGVPKKKLEEIADSMGIDYQIVDRIRKYVSQSGQKIRDTVTALAFSKMPFSDAKQQLEERFPDANLPWDVIEYAYNNLQSDKEDTEASQQEQNKWMMEQGFYPPYQIAIGGLGKDREQRGKYPRREEPVTFASILKPRKGKGVRDPGMSGDSPSLEDLQKGEGGPVRVRNIPARSRISTPRWTPGTSRQPGESKEFNPIKGLSPFVSKK